MVWTLGSTLKQSLKELVTSYNREISHYYIENMSGTKLDRPELSRLIENSEIDENGKHPTIPSTTILKNTR